MVPETRDFHFQNQMAPGKPFRAALVTVAPLWELKEGAVPAVTVEGDQRR